MITYIKSRKSIIDSKFPDKYVKMKIDVEEKTKNCKELKIGYCTIGVCDCEHKPCSGLYSYCPYRYIYFYQQPRKNSKDYKTFMEEFELQMTLKHLNNYIDENVEKAIYGELEQNEYNKVVAKLAKEMESYQITNALAYHKIFNDIRNMQIENKKKEADKVAQVKRVIFDIGDFYYIDIPHLPVLNNIWHLRSSSDAWILKRDFTKDIFNQLKKTEIQHWLQKEYNKNIEILENQMEEYYGLATMFALLPNE